MSPTQAPHAGPTMIAAPYQAQHVSVSDVRVITLTGSLACPGNRGTAAASSTTSVYGNGGMATTCHVMKDMAAQ